MSQRSRATRRERQQEHVHCASCFSRRCRARVEAGASCALGSCRLLCGALFHLCKEDEHLLLCPNVRVPCLNAAYGCPAQLTRHLRAAHLQVCPASVVSCSMEWNRWPANDAHSHTNAELHAGLMREREEEEGGGGLDLALALKDQDRLFRSMKMRQLFPELTRSVEEEEERKDEKRRRKRKEKKQREEALQKGAQTWENLNPFNFQPKEEEEDEEDEEEEEEEEVEEVLELSREEREAIARSSNVDAALLESYSAWERMFSMEVGGCRQAGEAAAAAGRGQGSAAGRERGRALEMVSEEGDGDPGGASKSCEQGSQVCTSSSSSSSCSTLGQKKFAYRSLEPMKIITVRTFKIPTSFSARHSRIRNPGFYRKKTSQAVDTSDLGVAPQDMPVWEEIQASLLCSLEKEQRGHLIAESACTDGLLQDEGTQTYNFLSAPFRKNSSLADLTAGKAPELHLQLQVESVTSRHHKASSAFTFLCGHAFQRREYGKHYKNIHSDIQMGVNGWFEQRCPLAYLGCTYSQRRFQPSTHEASVSYNESLGCFCLHPTVPVSLGDTSLSPRSSEDSCPTQRRGGGGGGGEGQQDSLSSLPYEVLCHVASFLDALSLSQLALVSHLLRQVCSSQLQERGMVTLRWERNTHPHKGGGGGGARWEVKSTVWQFSTMFSPVDTWRFRDQSPSMSEHLKTCPHFTRETRTDRVRLPRVPEEARVQTSSTGTGTSCKGPTLVGLFQQKRIMM